MGQLQGASTQAVLHGALRHSPNIITFNTCFTCLGVSVDLNTHNPCSNIIPCFSSCALTEEQKATAAIAPPSWKQPPLVFWVALWDWGHESTPQAATLSQPATTRGMSKLPCIQASAVELGAGGASSPPIEHSVSEQPHIQVPNKLEGPWEDPAHA